MAKTTKTKKKSTASKGNNKKNSRGAPAREEVRTRQYQAVVRYGIGFFALFLIITFFPGIDSGVLGGVREIFKGLFGFGYYFAPFFILPPSLC